MVAEYPPRTLIMIERRLCMIKKYVDEFGQKTIYLCLFGKRYVWTNGIYRGWYRA